MLTLDVPAEPAGLAPQTVLGAGFFGLGRLPTPRRIGAHIGQKWPKWMSPARLRAGVSAVVKRPVMSGRRRGRLAHAGEAFCFVEPVIDRADDVFARWDAAGEERL
jgi:hypothetical protein